MVSQKVTQLFAVRVGQKDYAALEVSISSAGDVYTNYLGRNAATKAHTSHHASGQHHNKISGEYVKWTGTGSGNWEPMILNKRPPARVEGRERAAVVGWRVGDISFVLFPVHAQPATVFSPTLSDDAILGFEVSIIGPDYSPRTDVLGFPVLARYLVTGAVNVEVEVFAIRPDMPAAELVDF